MTGNASTTATFKELFGQANFALEQIVPPHLETLAARLPGEPGVTLTWQAARKKSHWRLRS